jgi:hypothetical protein
MNRKVLLSAMSCLIFLGAQALAAPPISKPPKLEHMDYFHARKIILGYGWKPLGGPCLQVSADTCAHFPEIASCSGVEAAPCGMVFVKQDRCLYVGTSGGDPVGDAEGDTHVESVTFRSGPCSKN